VIGRDAEEARGATRGGVAGPLERVIDRMSRRGRAGSAVDPRQLIGVIRNTGWLLGERVLVMLTGMIVGIWVARSLGPADFGTYSFVVSFVALFGFLPTFGLQGIVTRELISSRDNRATILGTVVVMRAIGCLIGLVSIVTLALLRDDSSTVTIMMIIVAFGLPFDAFSVIDLWFQAQAQNKYNVLARGSALLLTMLLKVILILTGAPLVMFAFAEVAQQVLKATGFVAAYRWSGERMRTWQRNWPLGRTLLRQSWPLMLSSAGALVYLKIDQVMLGDMVGPVEVGVYSVAARISEVFYFLPMTIGTALFPAMMHSRTLETRVYHTRLQHAYTLMAWMATAVAVVVTLAAGPVIATLYGPEYSAAGTILAVHIWTCPAVFMGAVLNKWLIAEDLLFFALTRHGLGAVVNVGLNFVLIPRYGGLGAAIATLASYSVAYYLACYTHERTRVAGQMMTRALFSPITLPLGYLRRAVIR
jgi:polysaccharide transporter, PST family